jgi:AcrR family transcriptional regulator
MPSPRQSSPRNDRQLAILHAAERLFAERGFHAVTIRQIADAASVPLALIGYYYDHTEGLFKAIFAHHGHLHQEPLRALDGARRAAGEPGGLRRVVEAFVLPLLHWRRDARTRHYARLLAHELAHATPEAEPALRAHVDPLLLRIAEALQAALPKASRTELAEALRFALGAVQAHLSEHRLDQVLPGPRPDPATAVRLSELIAGGIHAALASAEPVPPAWQRPVEQV